MSDEISADGDDTTCAEHRGGKAGQPHEWQRGRRGRTVVVTCVPRATPAAGDETGPRSVILCAPYGPEALPERPMMTCHLCVEGEDHDPCCIVPMLPSEANQ